MREVHWCVTVDYQQIVDGIIANQIHGFTIDYRKFIFWGVIFSSIFLETSIKCPKFWSEICLRLSFRKLNVLKKRPKFFGSDDYGFVLFCLFKCQGFDQAWRLPTDIAWFSLLSALIFSSILMIIFIYHFLRSVLTELTWAILKALLNICCCICFLFFFKFDESKIIIFQLKPKECSNQWEPGIVDKRAEKKKKFHYFAMSVVIHEYE